MSSPPSHPSNEPGGGSGGVDDMELSDISTDSNNNQISNHPSSSVNGDGEVSNDTIIKDSSSPSSSTTWSLAGEVEAMRAREEEFGSPPRRLGVTWKDLTVEVPSSSLFSSDNVHENVISQFNLFRRTRETVRAKRSARRKTTMRTILDKSHGCVRPGEMLLVLGRPGSGCTTLLNLLANKSRSGYGSVTGEVHFGSMTDTEAAERYRGQIVMNDEEEVFFPTLTAGQTMDFATRMKVHGRKKSNKVPTKMEKDENVKEHKTQEELRIEQKDFLMRAMGIEHTVDTKIGNEHIRGGVSGGERKRISIVECMATRGSVYCWDNSTRGLDASNALEFIKCLRAQTSILGLTTIVTLYQPSNSIYSLFDKVLLLDPDGGKQIYYGPRDQARPFMESQGFVCSPAANVADFLTGVTVPHEREVLPQFRNIFPRNAAAIRDAYHREDDSSNIYPRMRAEEDEYPISIEARHNTQLFQASVRLEKKYNHDRSFFSSILRPFTTYSSNKNNYYSQTTTIPFFPSQIHANIIRHYQILRGDMATLYMNTFSMICQSIIAGSLFYSAPPTSQGIFIKSGSLFFSVYYHAMSAMAEVQGSFLGRPVVVKQGSYSKGGFAFYHPASYCVAQVVVDFPLVIFQVSVFSLPIYFMTGLNLEGAGPFFTYWAILVAITMCMKTLFRAIGSGFRTFDGASNVSGFVNIVTLLYAGFLIEKPRMHPWFEWIFWINPMAYAFDALISNEFHGKIIPCAANSLVPSGPGYTGESPASCAGVGGAVQGQTYVTGDAYLASLSYGYNHVWRNFGILWAWWALFVIITIFCTSRWRSASESGALQVIPHEKIKKSHALREINPAVDVESQHVEKHEETLAGYRTSSRDRRTATTNGEEEEQEGSDNNITRADLAPNTSIFTWRNLSYTVKTRRSGERKLLDNVQGWVKPGMLGALMGSSGAGKTTLLDVLAQRKTSGTITGSILVDGRPLPLSFQRSAGYCEQLDVHEPYTTVRESLEFSALLRQPHHVPKDEKLAYVDTILDLLELRDLEDTLIGGGGGGGLSVEQRKRVTIGVELVSKPSILLFLDEPTSGLDGQSAYNTVRFLRKLADAGQAVLVTIHQPSAQLFSQFDTLLLLAKGGRTVYFGDVGGPSADTVKDYFHRNGAPRCPVDANPAEYMIDVVSASSPSTSSWPEIWLSSPEHAAVVSELDSLASISPSSSSSSPSSSSSEFSTPLLTQLCLVTSRASLSLYRNTDYVNSKVALHVYSALLVGFTYYQSTTSSSSSPAAAANIHSLQHLLFAIFSFLFVAPGVINQLQPLFISRRQIFESRESRSRMYSWWAFVTGLIVSEVPYLIICAVLYFLCWYYTVGFPKEDSERAGGTLFVMILYEFIYTGIGQFIAAGSPDAIFAAMVDPLVVGILASFCGVLVPYDQLREFWRSWMYWLDPFNYLVGSLLVFGVWGTGVACEEGELAVFDPPLTTGVGNGSSGIGGGNVTTTMMTCGEYLGPYLRGVGQLSRLINPEAVESCNVCQFRDGSDYLRTLNLNEYSYGWRDAGIVVAFVFSSYGLVYVLMKLRTKSSKKAE